MLPLVSDARISHGYKGPRKERTMKYKSLGLTVLLAFAGSALVQTQFSGSLFAASTARKWAGSHPFVGTWKLNVAKSKPTGPPPTPKELTLIVEEVGDQSTVTIKGTNVDGSTISLKETFPSAGGGPVQFLEGGPPPGTSFSSTAEPFKAGSGTVDFTDTMDGKVIATHHGVVSADGKSFRLIEKGTDPQGKKYESVQVWDRT